MTDIFKTWKPSPAAEKAILAAQIAAEKRLQLCADFLVKNKVPEGGVLFQMRLPPDEGNPQGKLSMQVLWPGEVKVFKVGVGTLESANFADAAWRMPERLQQLRTRCPADRVLLRAYMRRAGTTPVRLEFDASGVLRVFHARTGKVLAVSVPGNPFKLSPDFKALSFHDLMPRIR